MQKFNVQEKKLTFVLLGNFNPLVFQPIWFGTENLLQIEEAENAEIKIVHPEIVEFNFDWMRFFSDKQKLLISSSKESYFEIIRDFVIALFRKLHHTPLSAMGINIDYIVKFNSLGDLDKFGHSLAPKSRWNKVFQNPGLLDLSIRDFPRADERLGYNNIRISSKDREKLLIDFRINEHFDLDKETKGTLQIQDIIEKEWSDIMTRSNEILNAILSED